MKRRRSLNLAVLALDTSGEELPAEFRLFVAGWNETENGNYLFDDEAAAAVMAAQDAHQVDRMIDLEHLSLDTESNNFDPDARGWCKLELRDDGSLWAVDVKWTEDGAQRLRDKRQRYVSPAFEIDPETKRVTKIVNIALTALPATHGTPELVAARTARDLRKLSTGPSLNDLQRAIQAAVGDLYPQPEDGSYAPYPYVCDVFDASAVYEYDGKLFEVAYTYDGSTAKLGAPVEVQRSYEPVQPAQPAAARRRAPQRLNATGAKKMTPEMIKKALEAIAAGDKDAALEILTGIVAEAAGGTATEGEGGETPPPPETNADDPAAPEGEQEEEEEQAAVMAATSSLIRLTGKPTIGAAVEEVKTWRASHLKLEQETERLAKEREALESSERRDLVAQLVKLGFEVPATAWANPTAKTLVPCKRLLAEPLAELRDRVAKLSAARGGKAPPAMRPPSGGHSPDGSTTEDVAQTIDVDGTSVELSARELKICREMGTKPEVYAANKLARQKKAS